MFTNVTLCNGRLRFGTPSSSPCSTKPPPFAFLLLQDDIFITLKKSRKNDFHFTKQKQCWAVEDYKYFPWQCIIISLQTYLQLRRFATGCLLFWAEPIWEAVALTEAIYSLSLGFCPSVDIGKLYSKIKPNKLWMFSSANFSSSSSSSSNSDLVNVLDRSSGNDKRSGGG